MSTVELSAELYAQAAKLAAATGRTVSDVVEDAVREKVTKSSPSAESKPFKLITFGEGGLLPGVDLNDSAGLLAIMEGNCDPS